LIAGLLQDQERPASRRPFCLAVEVQARVNKYAGVFWRFENNFSRCTQLFVMFGYYGSAGLVGH
jgi:hypothetical protein